MEFWKKRKPPHPHGTILSPWCLTFSKENLSFTPRFLSLPLLSFCPSCPLITPFFLYILPSFFYSYIKKKKNKIVARKNDYTQVHMAELYAFLSLKKKAFLKQKS